MTYRVVLIVYLWLVSACGSDSGGNGVVGPPPPNVLTVTVGGSSVCTNINEACTQVTICRPGTSVCQTISDILVDTGSIGIRIFGSILSSTLPQEVEPQGDPIGECMSFADGSALWGAVQLADVVLASEPAVTVPIHVIAPTFAGQSSSQNPCNSVVDSNPLIAGFNGILGIGLFTALSAKSTTTITCIFPVPLPHAEVSRHPYPLKCRTRCGCSHPISMG
jgi:hypothetical protein